MDATLGAIVRERRLRMANRMETMDWERLPKRVFYSTLVIDPQSAEPARKKRWCSNYKANLWTDLQRVHLGGDNESKLSKNFKCNLPEWKATLAQERFTTKPATAGTRWCSNTG
jgi:hypothetical protein